MMPLSIALAQHCDSCLRIGGASNGADKEAEDFTNRGKKVYSSTAEILEKEPNQR